MYQTNLAQIAQSADAAFRTDSKPQVSNLVTKIAKNSLPLADILYPTFGLRPSPKEKGQGTKDRLIVHAQVEDAKPYIEGRNIARYQVNWQHQFVVYHPHEMYSGRFPELFESPKLLVRAVLAGKNLIATVDMEKYYADQTLVCCVRPEDIQHKANVGPATQSQYSLYHFAMEIEH